MPRVLTMVETRTPAVDGARMRARFRRARDVARAGGVNYWVFTDGAEPSTWVEFFEGPDAQRVRSALRELEAAPSDHTILSEVELD